MRLAQSVDHYGMQHAFWFLPTFKMFRLAPPTAADEIVEDYIFYGNSVEERITERAIAGWKVECQIPERMGTKVKFVEA
jgi:hypothetical protein